VEARCNTFLAFRRLPHHQNCPLKCIVIRSYIAYMMSEETLARDARIDAAIDYFYANEANPERISM
jgi:hypothetical protein